MKDLTLLRGLKAARDSRKTLMENKAHQSLDTSAIVQTEDSELAGTRLEDGEPSVSVLLVESFDPDGRMLVTICGEELSATTRVSDGAAIVLRASVLVSDSKAPTNTLDELAFLKPYVYTGRRKEDGTEVVAMRVGIVKGGKVLDVRGRQLKLETSYSSQTGYTFIRKDRT